MSTSASSRRRRLSPHARREQILVAAAQLFGERPYPDVYLAEVAAQAGVAPGLIHHYFGGKRELFLEVVRYLVIVPPLDEVHLPEGSLDERINATVDWMLTIVEAHSSAWLTVVGLSGVGEDPEVERILDDADERAAERGLEAVGFSDEALAPTALVAVRCFGGMIKAGTREWLVHGRLSRAQLRILLVRTMTTILADAVPEMGTVAPARSRGDSRAPVGSG